MPTSPFNPCTNATYSGQNIDTLTAAMEANGWTNPRFVTFKQATTNTCYPRKGSHGVKVIKFGLDETTPDEHGNPTRFVKTYTVFNVEQLGGTVPVEWLEGDLDLYQAMTGEDLLTWSRPDLVKMINLATSHSDMNTIRLIESHLDNRDRQEELAEKRLATACMDDYIDAEIVKAEAACRGNLVNANGLANHVTPRHLWRWTLRRARKYATEELLRYWVDHPRLTKQAIMGDTVTRTRQTKDCYTGI